MSDELMMTKKENIHEQGKDSSGVDDIVTSLSDVVGAVMGVGAAVTKTFAEVTSGSKKISPPEEGSNPINVMVHYTMEGVTNVVSAVVGAVGGREDQETNQPTEKAAAKPQAAPVVPVVERGATLRIPLSIENPGDEPMQGMAFGCTAIEGHATAAGLPLSKAALRFQPEILDVAPKDFEKLTVFINTAEDTAPGDYTATIGLGGGTFESHVPFKVV